jgi:hypothetical protein
MHSRSGERKCCGSSAECLGFIHHVASGVPQRSVLSLARCSTRTIVVLYICMPLLSGQCPKTFMQSLWGHETSAKGVRTPDVSDLMSMLVLEPAWGLWTEVVSAL